MSAKESVGAQIFGGCFFLLYAIIGLWRAKVALTHHTVVWWFGANRPGRTWMDPWQATVAFSLCLALGLFLLMNAVQKIRKRRHNDPLTVAAMRQRRKLFRLD